MAGPSINTKVKLDGEKEYKAALSQIGTALKQLQSELNLSSERFNKNSDSIKALTEKGDILNRQILTQEEKIATLRGALQNAGETYKQSGVQTMRWQTDLNKAEQELIKMKRELRENRDALAAATAAMADHGDETAVVEEKVGGLRGVLQGVKDRFADSESAAKGLGTALTDVAEKLGIQLPDGAKKAIAALDGIRASDALVITSFGLLVSALTKAEKKLASMTKESAATARELKTLSSVTGQSTDALQEFAWAGDILGVSGDRIKDSLKEITNKMQDAKNGVMETELAFINLGVDITDIEGNLRNSNDVFYEVIDALGDVRNQTERDAWAMDLMSESAQELNPLIEAGSQTLASYAEEAKSMGYVLNESALTALTDVDAAYSRLQKTQEGVQNQMSAEFAPYLEKFYDKVTKLIKDAGDAMQKSGLVDSFGMLLDTFGNMIAPADTLSGETVPKLTNALRPLAELVAALADAADFLSGLTQVVTTNFWDPEWAAGWSKMASAAGFGGIAGYDIDGSAIIKQSNNNRQRLQELYRGQDTNATTEWTGYGQYYANGKYYANKDAYLMEQYEAALANGEAVGSFEYWKLSHNASGTDYWYGGRTLVGENGPEEVVLPRGSRITSASETRYSGAPVVHVGQIVIDAKNVREFNDVVRIMMNERISTRMEAK